MAAPDPLVLKRNESKNRELTETDEKAALDEDLESDDLLKSSTVPLWNVPYEDQVCYIGPRQVPVGTYFN